MKAAMDLIQHWSAVGWPLLSLLSLASFGALWLILSPRPIRLTHYKPDQQFPPDPSQVVWDELAATAVSAFADWGLPLGEDGALVRYEVSMDTNGRIQWTGGSEAHLQQVNFGGDDYVLKIMPKAGNPHLLAAFNAIYEARTRSAALEHYLCPVRLLPQAISIMDENRQQRWADVTIAPLQREMILDFIIRNLKDDCSEIELRILARNFRWMVREIHRQGWIFGDHHIGNIAVDEDRDPIIIDLDTFSHRSRPAAALSTVGHSGFQIPLRARQPKLFARHAEKLDYFSEWVIYTSLMAYAILGKTLPVPKEGDATLLFDEENLLEEKLNDPGSPFETLEQSGHPLLMEMAARIRASCSASVDPGTLEPLEAIFTDKQFAAWEMNTDSWYRRSRYAAS